MSRFILTVRNVQALRHLSWRLDGVSVLVGANGAGKTTALLVLKLLRAALDRGWPSAFNMILGGSHGVRSRDAAETESVELQIEVDALRWRVVIPGRSMDDRALFHESLFVGDDPVFTRDETGQTWVRGVEPAPRTVSLKSLSDGPFDLPEVERMVRFVRGIAVYHDPDLYGLRAGSDTTQSRHLHSRGQNALTMLRQWHQRRPDRWRYAFVLKGLRAAFPGLIEDLDFVEAGTTLVARVYRPRQEHPDPLWTEANGVLAMLINLCALAAVDDGGVIAIDEPENALHPYAIRVFARRAELLARQRGVTVILSTHSPVVLDHFGDRPQQVYVLDPERPQGPTPLTELKNPDWLHQFRLGTLYADGEIASNADVG